MSATHPSLKDVESSSTPAETGVGDERIKIKDVEFPVRRWAVACISLLTVLLGTCLGGIYVWRNWNEAEAKIRSMNADNDAKISSLNAEKTKLEKAKSDSEEATRAKLEEYKFHFGEKGQVLTAPNGWVKITTYPSDGCILISRKDANSPYGSRLDDWILSPLKVPKSTPPDAAAKPASFDVSQPPPGAPDRPDAVPPGELRSIAFAQSIRQELGQADRRLMPVQSGCQNPHPGSVRSSWGKPNGCWVPLFRTWRDGCNHYQWYNSCSGQWNPKIYWNFCAAKHYW